jgi:ABC-type amino acid transport substrate-binding protein
MNIRTFLAILLLSFTVKGEGLLVISPGEGTNEYSRLLPASLLKLALEKSGQKYEMKPYTGGKMTQSRLLESLKRDDKIVTVTWAGTSLKREDELAIIRIPIYRGLMGKRVALINAKSQAQFSEVKEIDDLKKFVMGQVLGWASIDIFRDAGLNVIDGDYESIFRMLENERIDYFPMGIVEIFDSYNSQKEKAELKNIVIEKDLVFQYEFDIFYFVNKQNQALKKAIEDGLNKAYLDGSYLEAFNKDPEVIKAKNNLNSRRILKIHNPYLSKETASIPAKYWE